MWGFQQLLQLMEVSIMQYFSETADLGPNLAYFFIKLLIWDNALVKAGVSSFGYLHVSNCAGL